MNAEYGQIERELDILEEQFSRYFSLTNEGFQSAWNRRYDEQSLASAHKTSVEGLESENEELHKRLDKACAYYLGATNEVRESLRRFVGSRHGLLVALREHVGWCASRIAASGDKPFLRTGIAAVSLQDNRLDFRDNYLALGDLYLTAIKAGIQPGMDFCKIGLLSGSESRNKKWPKDSTQNFLTGFEDSAYFRDSIAPKLR